MTLKLSFCVLISWWNVREVSFVSPSESDKDLNSMEFLVSPLDFIRSHRCKGNIKSSTFSLLCCKIHCILILNLNDITRVRNRRLMWVTFSEKFRFRMLWIHIVNISFCTNDESIQFYKLVRLYSSVNHKLEY